MPLIQRFQENQATVDIVYSVAFQPIQRSQLNTAFLSQACSPQSFCVTHQLTEAAKGLAFGMTQRFGTGPEACWDGGGTAPQGCVMIQQATANADAAHECTSLPGWPGPAQVCQPQPEPLHDDQQQLDTSMSTSCLQQLPESSRQQQHISSRPTSSKRLQQLMAHKSHQMCSLLVMAQVLRLLLTLSADPAAVTVDHHLRSQLMKELKAAAVAARLNGEHTITAITLLKHLPKSRLQQVRAAARKHPRKSTAAVTAVRNNSSSSSSSGGGSSDSSDLQTPLPQPFQFPAAALQPQLLQQQQRQLLQSSMTMQQQPQQQQPPAVDVCCLLETTLVAAAAEAQLNSFSLGAHRGDSLADDASSAVDIEGVMMEEFELVKQSGML